MHSSTCAGALSKKEAKFLARASDLLKWSQPYAEKLAEEMAYLERVLTALLDKQAGRTRVSLYSVKSLKAGLAGVFHALEAVVQAS